MLMALLAARQQGGAGMSATGTGNSGDAVDSAGTQLQGADPAYMLKEATDLKRRLVGLITPAAFRIPGAARALSSCLKGLDSAIKELQQAQSTAEAVAGGPVALSAIPQPSPPGALGASPPQPSGQTI